MARYQITFSPESIRVELHMGKPLQRVAVVQGVNSWGLEKLIPLVTDEAARRRAPSVPFTYEQVNAGEEAENDNR
jgi:hypothetical protein